MKTTWFYKVAVNSTSGLVSFQTWVAEGDSYCQSGASLHVPHIVADRYWDGF